MSTTRRESPARSSLTYNAFVRVSDERFSTSCESAHATVGLLLLLVVPDSISRHLRVGPAGSDLSGAGRRGGGSPSPSRDPALKGVADTKQGSELLKNSARRIVRSRNDLLPRECREIVAKLPPQEHVRDGTELHTAAHTEDDFPHIVRREAGNLRNRLGERLRAGNDIFLRAGASS